MSLQVEVKAITVVFGLGISLEIINQIISEESDTERLQPFVSLLMLRKNQQQVFFCCLATHEGFDICLDE